jgi:hypothetical protein
VLASFLYLDKLDPDLLKKRKQKHPHIRFFCDSGAHSLQADKQRYGNWSLVDFENYLRRYVKWIRDNRSVLDCAVELDIDFNVGTPVVEGWQKKFFLPLVEEGIPIIFVWHPERGHEGFEEMCSRFPYVGLPGEKSSEPDFNKFISVARRYTTKLHAFGAMKLIDYRDWSWAWASLDGTSWKAAERYGTLIHWDAHAQRMVFEENKAQRAQYRKFFEEAGLDAEGIIRDTNYREVTKYALISFVRMQKFYEEKYRQRQNFYQLRLPHPQRVLRLKDVSTLRYWRLFRPEILFKNHAQERQTALLRIYLSALAAVQYREQTWLEAHSLQLKFLAEYFPKQVLPKITDAQTFQKELSSHIAFPNPPAMDRTAPEHFFSVNAPKEREAQEYSVLDLEPDIALNCLEV